MTEFVMDSAPSQRDQVSFGGSPLRGSDSGSNSGCGSEEASAGVGWSLVVHGRPITDADEKPRLPHPYWRPLGDSSASASDMSAHAAPTMYGDRPASHRPAERVGAASGINSMPWDAVRDTQPPRKKKRLRKYRKGTHTLRKEEIATLHDTIVELRTQLDALKSSSFPTADSGAPETEQDRELREKVFTNRLLRRAIRKQQTKFAPVHALMSRFTLSEAEGGCPLHQFMHLGNDEHLRQTALNATKTNAINRGKAFLQQRWPCEDPWRPMKQEHYFESSAGDYIGLSVAALPFRKITDVKSAFDAVLTFFNNLEISASEEFGSITIREDTDMPDSGIAQHRLVTTAPCGLRMESNTMFFSCYYDADSGWGDQPEHGVIICDFVDHDTRYPYHPRQRIRRDVSAVVEVKKRVTRDDLPAEEEREAVVLTRWVQTKLHQPTFPVEPEHWDQLCDKMERWVHILQPKLLEGIV